MELLKLLNQYAGLVNFALFATIIGILIRVVALTRTSLQDKHAAEIEIRKTKIGSLEAENRALGARLIAKDEQHQSKIDVLKSQLEYFQKIRDARDAEYKAHDAQHESELAEKDRIIKQLQADTYPAAAEASATMISLVGSRDAALKMLKEDLDKTQLEEREKAELLERMKSQFSSEQCVLKAVLDIGSEDPSARLKAARELLKIRDPRTIPRLVQTLSAEIFPTSTKQIVMKALKEFGEDAVPSLIDEMREYARMVSELDDPSEDPKLEAWRAAVLKSDAGNLLVRIGTASIPSLQELRNNEGLLGEAAGALLTAINERQ